MEDEDLDDRLLMNEPLSNREIRTRIEMSGYVFHMRQYVAKTRNSFDWTNNTSNVSKSHVMPCEGLRQTKNVEQRDNYVKSDVRRHGCVETRMFASSMFRASFD